MDDVYIRSSSSRRTLDDVSARVLIPGARYLILIITLMRCRSKYRKQGRSAASDIVRQKSPMVKLKKDPAGMPY